MPLTERSALAKDRRNAAAADVMQHRHYAIVAGIVATLDPASRADVARHFANQLRATNTRFNRSRFLTACNVED